MSENLPISFGKPIKKSDKVVGKVNLINQWVLVRLGYDVKDPFIHHGKVMVLEILCNDPTCVPIETMIILMKEVKLQRDEKENTNERWTTKVLKPLDLVTEEDINEIDFPLEYYYPDSIEWILQKLDSIINSANDVTLCNKITNALQHRVEQIKKRAIEINQPIITRVKIKPSNSTTSASNHQIMIDNKANNASIITNTKSDDIIINSNNITSAGETSEIASKTSSNPKPTTSTSLMPPPISSFQYESMSRSKKGPNKRHEKGTRPRGCPCCDPDNLDNIIDRMLFLDVPPN